jgi:bifunctional N-acetylglucosamine-1-phosphate-uridyltransferase/glucosamine-1-phosphate-acetyltransferase GlmU-like protein
MVGSPLRKACLSRRSSEDDQKRSSQANPHSSQAEAEAALRQRINRAWMLVGTMIDPADLYQPDVTPGAG